MANIIFTKSSGVNDSIFGKSEAPIRAFIEKKAEAFEEKSFLPLLFAMEQSENFGEKFTSLTAMDGFKPMGENGTYPTTGMQEGYSKLLESVTWKNSFTISKEMIEDGKLIDLKQKPNNFITSYYRTREHFGAALYGGAIGKLSKVKFEGMEFDTTVADGKPLFDKQHEGKVSGKKQSNLFTDAFSADALAAVETEMQNFKGDNDELLAVTPDTIMIPNIASLKKAVFATVGADCDPNTSNNGYNYHFGRWNIIVNPYLNKYVASGSTPWILLSSEYNAENYGAVLIDRVNLEIGSRVDETNDANVWSGRARFTGGFVDWRFAAVGGVAGGTTLLST